MIYPSIDKLLTIVDSKYILVHVAAERSKEMINNKHYQLREDEYTSVKEIGRSLEELEKGLIEVKK